MFKFINIFGYPVKNLSFFREADIKAITPTPSNFFCGFPYYIWVEFHKSGLVKTKYQYNSNQLYVCYKSTPGGPKKGLGS